MRKTAHREIEVKIRMEDLRLVRSQLRKLGFRVLHPRSFEDNVLYDTPDGAFRNARSIIRLRQYGSCWTLGYKGAPARDPHYKSRTEWETEVAQPEVLRAIFAALGLQPAFRYQKYRTEYARVDSTSRRNTGGKVVVDETPIGNFLELEGSRAWIDRTARQLGYTRAAYETASYGTLYQKACRQAGRTPRDMIFSDRLHG
ncbi:MAG: class IV adenylate cyclase [Acidobacteria bacterium]|nr:class IV adenylate cyclase [Acidobacteriota bacterium]